MFYRTKKLKENILAVLSCEDWISGLEIHRKLESERNYKIGIGTLYPVLHSLEKEGKIEFAFGEATPERGGNRQGHYRKISPG